jgi:hypothetical protein
MPQRHTEGEVSIAPIIFNLCTSCRQRSASHTSHSSPHRNSSLYPLNRSLCGSLAGLDVSKKRYISCHCRHSNPRSSSLHPTPLVLSHYCSPVDFEVSCICVLHPYLCIMLCLFGPSMVSSIFMCFILFSCIFMFYIVLF